ncbi:hypothetical protein VNO80_02874 [Phaseolus coccineus]|uniref:Uncharacterized protein n=1 Tax=Phaseolus coccineus TaxID=3886 RepID=A0AAN9RMQ1_PHACN
MADEEVDFSKLFLGDDDDDDMFYIDMQILLKVFDEDDDYDFLENKAGGAVVSLCNYANSLLTEFGDFN